MITTPQNRWNIIQALLDSPNYTPLFTPFPAEVIEDVFGSDGSAPKTIFEHADMIVQYVENKPKRVQVDE